MEPEENLLLCLVTVIDLLNDNLAFHVLKRTWLSLLFDGSYESAIGAIFFVFCFLYSDFLQLKTKWITQHLQLFSFPYMYWWVCCSLSFIAEIGHHISFEHLCLVKDFIFYIQKEKLADQLKSQRSIHSLTSKDWREQEMQQLIK